MQALAAGGLHEAFEALRFEPVLHFQRPGDDFLPFDTLARIEIEDDPVGLLELFDARAPGMNFQHIRLHERHEPVEILNGKHRFALADIDRNKGFVGALPQMLGIEA